MSEYICFFVESAEGALIFLLIIQFFEKYFEYVKIE